MQGNFETSGLVCDSLKGTVQDKLADKDMEMKWVENGIYKIDERYVILLTWYYY